MGPPKKSRKRHLRTGMGSFEGVEKKKASNYLGPPAIGTLSHPFLVG